MNWPRVFDSNTYIDLEAARIGGEPAWFDLGVDEEIGLIARSIPNSRLTDLVSVYGYPDLFSRFKDGEAGDQLTRFMGQARKRGYVSAYLRLGLDQRVTVPKIKSSDACGVCKNVGDVVFVDVAQPLDKIVGGYRKSLRYDLKQKHHLSIDRSSDYLSFYQIYIQNMERVGAAPSYFFSEAYIAKLGTIPGVELWMAYDPVGPVAGGLFFDQGKLVYYHLGATASRALNKSPLKNVLHAKISDLVGSGRSKLILGGGVGGQNDALLRFKRGFSKLTSSARALQLVLNAEQYLKLCGDSATPLPSQGFFPAYRQ